MRRIAPPSRVIAPGYPPAIMGRYGNPARGWPADNELAGVGDRVTGPVAVFNDAAGGGLSASGIGRGDGVAKCGAGGLAAACVGVAN